jgi:DNA-binding NarL/FixJ family response regulator
MVQVLQERPASEVLESGEPVTIDRLLGRLTTRSLQLLVVDTHPVVHIGVQAFVSKVALVRSVAQAPSGADAVHMARLMRPELVLLDPWLDDMLLAEVVDRLRAVSPSARIIVFAAQLTPSILDEAARLAVHGVLSKSASRERFLDVICRVAAGEVVIEERSERMLERVAEKLHGSPLTAREHEIIRRAARGESNVEIARAIYLAPTTVKSYLQSALGKLGVRNRVEAVFKLSELRIL